MPPKPTHDTTQYNTRRTGSSGSRQRSHARYAYTATSRCARSLLTTTSRPHLDVEKGSRGRVACENEVGQHQPALLEGQAG